MVQEDTLARIEAERKAAYERSQKRLKEIRDSRRSQALVVLRKVAVLAVLVAALVAVLLHLYSRRTPAVTELSLASFSSIPAAIKVVNRSPTIIIVVDKKQWEAMSADLKRMTVADIGRIASGSGYWRAQIRAKGTGTLAEWKKDGTVKLIRPK